MKTKILSKSLYRVLTALLSAAMIMASVTLPVLAEGEINVSDLPEFSADANISSVDAFKISSETALIAFASAIKDDNAKGTYSLKGKAFYLANDIDLKGEEFTPIANVSSVSDGFAGTFDGLNHTIKGLKINSNSDNGVGLFGTINGATIKNLKVEGNISASGSTFVGGIIGKTQGNVVVDSCSFSGSVSNNNPDDNDTTAAGGIVGRVNYAKKSVKISNCANSAEITSANGLAAGIIGYSSSKVVLSNCYNTGNISSKYYASGIGATLSKTASTITNCYNSGITTNTNKGTYNAGISANFKGKAINCYSKYSTSDKIVNGTNGSAAPLPDGGLKASNLGDAFKDGSNGYPILIWQESDAPVKTEPSVKINGAADIYMTNVNPQPTITLLGTCENMDSSTQKVKWSIEEGDDIISGSEDNNSYIITPKKAGKAKVKATVTYEKKEYSATAEITVMPYITTVEIDGNVNVGETVRAKINVLGGKDEYDYQKLPVLPIVWKYSKDNGVSFETIKTVTTIDDYTYTIPKEYEGYQLFFSFTYKNGETSEVKMPSRAIKIGPSIQSIVDNDSKELSINDADIKAETHIELPKMGTNGSTITWKSSDNTIINPETGEVKLPNTGIAEIELTATVSYLEASPKIRKFKIKVYSQAQIAIDKENKLSPVTNTLKALGEFYKLMPKFGTDKNIVEMFKSDLVKKAAEKKEDINGFDVKLVKTEVVSGNGNSSIDKDGNISYYYVDPNKYPTQHLGTHKADFSITFNGETVNYDNVSVIVDWDEKRVEDDMTSQILSQINIPNETSEDIELPKIVGDKKWAIVSWSSNDTDYISVLDDNKTSADTALAPYSAVIKRGAADKRVELTATCKFNFSDNENPIIVRKVYPVTVKAIDAAAAEEIKKGLDEKLDTGFKKAGLTDAVTGEKLSADESGKITVTNDIKFPTTRDFGIDGKEFPVSITTDNHDVVITPDVNNAARVEVIRPAVGKSAATAKITLSVTDKNTNVSASREYTIEVPALTKSEIDAEKALMAKVKDAYFDGIRGVNTDKNDIGSNLRSFTEVYEENGELKWVRDNKSMVGHGIVPTPLDGWYDLQAWRLFRSSNPAVISHENLLVTKQTNGKSVTVDSALSSETLGKYGELYNSDKTKYADYKDLEELYYQPVSVELTVRGTSTRKGVKPTAVSEKINVSFTLMDNKKTLIDTVEYKDQDETTTVYDIFKKAMDANKYTYEKQGTYIPSITMPDGTKLGALDRGQNSGWMYKVNGKIPDVSMGAYGLSDGDKIIVFYTNDYTKESGMSHYGGGSSGRKNNNTNTSDQNKNDDTLKPNENNGNSAVSFDDVKADDWYYKAISFVCGKNIMRGTGEKLFEPDGLLNRAMFVTILYRMESEPSASAIRFSDVKNGEWYTKAVAWASENGIVNGISDSEFAPEDNITREQMAAIIYRYIKFKGEDVSVGENTNILSYDDAEDISEYAIPAFCYVGGAGIMSGRTQSTLNPTGTATRAEAATVIMRMFDNGLVK